MNYLLYRFTAFLRQKGLLEEAYLVGGAVRDILLGRELKDMDIAIKGDTIGLSREFAYATDASFVLLDEEFSVARVVKGEYWLDISKMRCDSLFIDLSERDFTINAMAIPLSNLQDPHRYLIDVFNGLEDLQQGIIRMVSEENFIKDPLRIIRAFRFAATLNYSISDQTLQAIKGLTPLISSVSYERIADELKKTLLCQNSAPIVRLMVGLKVFTHVFAMTFRETQLEGYCRLENMVSDVKRFFPEVHFPIARYLCCHSRTFALKFTTLFEGHTQAVDAARQLRLSKRDIELIQRLIELSGLFYRLYKTGVEPDTEEVIRFFLNAQKELYGAILFDLAHHNNGYDLLNYANRVIAFYEDQYRKRQALLPLITGQDLIEGFGLSTSPVFRKILNHVEFLTLCGKASSREEALRAVSEFLGQTTLPQSTA